MQKWEANQQKVPGSGPSPSHFECRTDSFQYDFFVRCFLVVFYSNVFSFKMYYKTIFNWMDHEAWRVKWCISNQARKLNGLSEMQNLWIEKMYIYDKLSSEIEKNGRTQSCDDNIPLNRLSFFVYFLFCKLELHHIIGCEIHAKMFAYS